MKCKMFSVHVINIFSICLKGLKWALVLLTKHPFECTLNRRIEAKSQVMGKIVNQKFYRKVL